MLLKEVINHPVHILNNEGDFSPSSLIPFCSFGKEFVGSKINEFEIPVCNIFKPKIYFDQLCFETDLQKMKDNKTINEQLELGLTLVLDYNEERQINDYIISKNYSHEVKAFYNDDDVSASIYLDTISMNFKMGIFRLLTVKFLDPVRLFGEGQYNLNNMKEISVTDSFLGLDRDTRNCQNIETYNDCKTRLYVETLRSECGCLPLSLKLSEKVKEKKITIDIFFIIKTQDNLCMTTKEIYCSKNIKTENLTSCIRLSSLK